MKVEYLIIYFVVLFIGMLAYIIATKFIINMFQKINIYYIIQFVLIFTTSINLLFLLIIEMIYGKNQKDYFLSNIWYFNIMILNYFVLFLSPISFIFILCSKITIVKFKRIILISLILIHFYIILKLLNWEDNNIIKSKDSTEKRYFGFLYNDIMFNLLIKIGTIIISILSGFSIIYVPFIYWRIYNKNLIGVNKKKIKEELSLIMNEWRISKLKLSKEYSKKKNVQNSGGKLSFMNFFFKNNNEEKNVAILKEEILQNQDILNNLYADYTEIKNENKILKDNLKNKYLYFLRKIIAYILIIIGVQRLIMTLYNLLFINDRKINDPIYKVLQIIIYIFNIKLTEKEFHIISGYCSFFFIGILVITNLNSFANNFIKFLRIFFKSYISQFVSQEFILIFSGQIIGVYLVSSFYMIEIKIHEKYKINLSENLKYLNHNSIFNVSDKVFFISTLIFFIMLIINIKYKNYKYSTISKKNY